MPSIAVGPAGPQGPKGDPGPAGSGASAYVSVNGFTLDADLSRGVIGEISGVSDSGDPQGGSGELCLDLATPPHNVVATLNVVEEGDFIIEATGPNVTGVVAHEAGTEERVTCPVGYQNAAVVTTRTFDGAVLDGFPFFVSFN